MEELLSMPYGTLISRKRALPINMLQNASKRNVIVTEVVCVL
jgi:hypothetical protein